MTKVAIITLHGQGSFKTNAHKKMIKNILDEIDYNRGLIEVFPVLYYSKAQANQSGLISRMKIARPRVVSWVRDKIISSFGDPASIYHNKQEYDYVMQKIKKEFIKAQAYVGENGSIVVVAHSLGGVLISNYLWDAQKAGIKYRRLKLVATTGNPYGIFVSAINYNKIEAMSKPCFGFKWLNFWNKKDALSAPMQILSDGYKYLVKDIEVKKGFWFFAHAKYKDDKNVYREIANVIKGILD